MDTNLEILVAGCRQNNLQSQRMLYELCYPDMIKICYRYAKDTGGAGTIFNDAMLKVFKNIAAYKEEGKLMAWIKTIVINCSIDYSRKQIKFGQVLPEAVEDIHIDPDVLDRVSGKEIQQLLKRLPGATATVFNMFVYDGFTHKQIALLLNISEGTSKWHVSEAKKLLKPELEKLNLKEFKTNAAG